MLIVFSHDALGQIVSREIGNLLIMEISFELNSTEKLKMN